MIIASFPKGSYPEYTWPIGTWPAAPEAAVDIQYTEVMEFAVCIAASAGFSVVLPNDGSEDVTDTNTMIVAGAGTSEVNGTYTYYSLLNSKPRYNKSGTDLSIWWYSILTFKYWQLVDNTNKYYRSYDNVATPDLCTTWVAVDGAEPAPTITASQIPTLTEIAAFTLEMPMIIDFELYEELSA